MIIINKKKQKINNKNHNKIINKKWLDIKEKYTNYSTPAMKQAIQSVLGKKIYIKTAKDYRAKDGKAINPKIFKNNFTNKSKKSFHNLKQQNLLKNKKNK